jgi:hypothetical protein
MYPAETQRIPQTCLLLLIDQSSSMGEWWKGTGTSKAGQLALTVNRILGNAAMRCAEDDRHDPEVGVLGYRETVRSVLHGSTDRRPLVPVSQLAVNPKRLENISREVPDGIGGTLEVASRIPIWVDTVAEGAARMAVAVDAAERIVRDWCDRHPRGCPPVVFNVTSATSPDEDPRPAAARLRSARTALGSSLLFNVRVSGRGGNPVRFPDNAAGLPDRLAAMLFCMSSPLPPAMATAAAELGYAVSRDSLGFLYDPDATTMLDFLDIVTRPITGTGATRG